MIIVDIIAYFPEKSKSFSKKILHRRNFGEEYMKNQR